MTAYQVRILAPRLVATHPWDVLRRLGLRPPQRKQFIKKGMTLVCPRLNTVFVRPEDYRVATHTAHLDEPAMDSLPVFRVRRSGIVGSLLRNLELRAYPLELVLTAKTMTQITESTAYGRYTQDGQIHQKVIK